MRHGYTAGRLRVVWLALLLCIALLGAQGPAFGTGTPGLASTGVGTVEARDLDRIHPDLLHQIDAAGTQETLRALVVLGAEPDLSAIAGDRDAVVSALKSTAATSQADVVRTVETRGDRVLNSFWIQNMLLVEARADTLVAASSLPGVQRIVPNFTVTSPEPQPSGDIGTAIVDDRTYGIDRIGAHQVWSELGIDGSGIRVATLDTGVDIGHPDLAGKMVTDDPGDPAYPGGWLRFDAAGNPISSVPSDSASHGTHVSGTIQGGADSGVSIGVAPGAQMMHGLVIPGGSGTFGQVAAGMEWAIDPFDVNGEGAGQPAHVVNMSLGGVGFFQEMVAPTRNMRAAGVFPAFAIGNNCGAVGTASPGNVYESVAVGATDVNDNVAGFSCGGVVQASQFPSPPADWPASWVKPNISAPGVNTYSSLPGGGYGNNSGTSMATPHVAGTVALMLAAAPGLSIDDAFDTLATTSFWDDRHGPDRPNTRFGEGRINAYEAVTLVAFDSGIEGTVTDSDTGAAVSGATVHVVETGVTRTTGADGTFEVRLAPGSYTVEVTRFGYEDATASAVVVAEQFTTVDIALEALPRGDIAGTVTYAPSGHGVPGATVAVLDVPVEIKAETASGGTYTITGVPEGTYLVRASAPGLPAAGPVEVTVVADEVATADFEIDRPERVAVLGDFGTKLTDELAAAGLDVESHTWASLGDVGQYSAIVVNRPGIPGAATFLAFLDDTDAAGTGVVFLDTWSTSGNGVWLLFTYLSNPATRSTGFSSSIPMLTYEVLTSHPVIEGYDPGDTIVHDNSTSDKDHAWFGGYEGEGRIVLANASRSDLGVRGGGIGVQDRGTNRHVLLSMHGASQWAGPEIWTAETRTVFYQALDWVGAAGDEDEARFALWDFDVEPEVILGGQDVTVSAGVKNIGTVTGDYTATLHVDGVAEQSQTVTLASGESTSVAFTTTREAIGTYTVSIGGLSGQFRVRPPLVSIEASRIDGTPLAGASVELVDDDVSSVGFTGADGRLEFEAPAAVTDTTVVVRRMAEGDHPHAYLLSEPVVITEDTSLVFAPDAGSAVVADLSLSPVDSSHESTTYLANDHTSGWGFAHSSGSVVLTPGTYTARHVHTVDGLASQWWLPSRALDLDWTEPGPATHGFGGAATASLADIRDQEPPDFEATWDVTDGHGHGFATVFEGEPQPFATAAGEVVRIDDVVDVLRAAATHEHDPVLRLLAPDGAVLRSGVIGWDDQPVAFDYATEEMRLGRHDLTLIVETGGYSDRIEADAQLVVPARALSSPTASPGGTFQVTVVFDAPDAQSGLVSLTETLPDGFTVTGYTATPMVHPQQGFDGQTWTWRPKGGLSYTAGGLIEVTYTVSVGSGVSAGAYPLSGVAVHHGSGLARAVAGPGSITIE